VRCRAEQNSAVQCRAGQGRAGQGRGDQNGFFQMCNMNEENRCIIIIISFVLDAVEYSREE
jgi:hypothetical protein